MYLYSFSVTTGTSTTHTRYHVDGSRVPLLVRWELPMFQGVCVVKMNFSHFEVCLFSLMNFKAVWNHVTATDEGMRRQRRLSEVMKRELQKWRERKTQDCPGVTETY